MPNRLQQSPQHKPSHAQCKTLYLGQTTTEKIPKWVLSFALLILVWNPFFELSLPRLIDVMIWCTRMTAKSCQTLLFVRPKPTTRPSITEYKDNKLIAINSCLEMLKIEWPLFTVYILGQWDLYYFSVLLHLILSSLNWADINLTVPGHVAPSTNYSNTLGETENEWQKTEQVPIPLLRGAWSFLILKNEIGLSPKSKETKKKFSFF